jgi:hypothetical protein
MRGDEPIGACRALTTVPTFADRQIVFVDSVLALATAKDAGLPATAEIRTTAPALLVDPAVNVVAVDCRDPERRRRIAESTETLALEFRKLLGANPTAEKYLPCLDYVAANFQRVLLKAASLDAADFDRKVAVVSVDTGSSACNAVLNSPWPALLTEHRDFVILTVDAKSKERRSQQHPVYDLWRRIGFYSANKAIEWSALNFWSKFQRFKGRGLFLVLTKNELSRDALTSLALRGFAVRNLPAAGKREAPADGDPGLWLAGHIEAAFHEVIQPIVPGPVFPALWRLFKLQLNEVTATFDSALRYWTTILEQPENRRARAILGNVPRNPHEMAVRTAAAQLRIPFVAFQHGVSREYNQTPGNVRCLSENSLADVFVCFSDRCSRVADKNPFKKGVSAVAGLPSEMWRTGCFRPRIPGIPPVLYASTGLYGGNVNIDRGSSMTDIEIARFELGIAENVLAKLPHRVRYKTYPAVRYLDHDPVLVAAQKANNIEIFSRQIDLRFLLPDAQVVITARATSTLGWCLMSEKPLVFVDVPGAFALDQGAAELLSRGVFFFDAADPSFYEKLRSFLSRPIADIERDYLSRRSARNEARDRFFQTGGPGAGRRAADLLLAMT